MLYVIRWWEEKILSQGYNELMLYKQRQMWLIEDCVLFAWGGEINGSKIQLQLIPMSNGERWLKTIGIFSLSKVMRQCVVSAALDLYIIRPCWIKQYQASPSDFKQNL